VTYLLDERPEPPVPERPDAPQAEPPMDPSRTRRTLRSLLPFLGGAVAMLAIVLLVAALQPRAEPLTRTDVKDAIASALASQTPPPARGEAVYAAVSPSIVLIETKRTVPGGRQVDGEGTGVVVSANGQILTALHVVAGADSISLRFADGTRSTGTISSTDTQKDIAVLLPDTPVAAPPAVLGNPAALHVGSDAFVVGNPFGLYESLSAGVVSAIDRSFRDPEANIVRTGLIQVDAAVNPGNSGGPLLDRDGRVVGIVTSLINPSGQETFLGIGLAVPIDVAGGAAGLPPY
jgi:S1-C subfamily serine protease